MRNGAMPRRRKARWLDGYRSGACGAENIEQAYALLNFLLSPEVGGMFSNNTGYNSAAAGSAAHMSEAGRAAFEFAYPGDAIANLWWWPMFTPWFSQVREEYVEKLTNAYA